MEVVQKLKFPNNSIIKGALNACRDGSKINVKDKWYGACRTSLFGQALISLNNCHIITIGEKMKISLLSMSIVFMILFAACVSSSVPEADTYSFKPISETTAGDLVSLIRAGWNLGNTLDTADLHWLRDTAPVSDYEKAWGNPLTTKENIDTVKKAGFNTIRIPVSWAKCADSEYNIRKDWLERVEEVVDYAVSNNMIIILNTHHDESIFKFMDEAMEKSKKAFRRIWEQIADKFRDHGTYLIFECLNEPRTIGGAREWNGGTAEEHANLNDMHQVFVDTVRASGGNNADRILMLPAYGASSAQAAINALKIPNDSAENKIIVSIHAYEPYNFALNGDSPVNTWDKAKAADTAPVTGPIDRAYDLFVCKGIPVILGEMGALNKNNENVRADWVEFNVSYARSKGIPCIWWDDGGNFRLLDRQNNIFLYPKIVRGIMNGSK
jgi:endoglucanase